MDSTNSTQIATEKFELLWSEHSDALRRFCRQQIASPHDADDIFCEAFIALWAALGQGKQVDHPLGWLRRVATRKRNLLLKNRQREKDRLKNDRLRDRSVAPAEGSDTATTTVEDREFFEALLAQLEPEEHEVITLHLKGKSYAEAADALRITPGNFGIRLSRAKEKLRCVAAERGVACPVLGLGVGNGGSQDAGVSLFDLKARLLAQLQSPDGVESLISPREASDMFRSKALQYAATALVIATAALGIAIPSLTLDTTPAVNAADPAPPQADLTGAFINAGDGGTCRVIKGKDGKYTFIDESGKVAKDVVVNKDGSFEAFGIRGRMAVKEGEIQWPGPGGEPGPEGNRWLSYRSVGAHAFYFNRGRQGEPCLANATVNGIVLTDERGSNSLVEFVDDCSLKFKMAKWTAGPDGKPLEGEFKAPQGIHWPGGHWSRKAVAPAPVVIPGGPTFEFYLPLDCLFKAPPKK